MKWALEIVCGSAGVHDGNGAAIALVDAAAPTTATPIVSSARRQKRGIKAPIGSSAPSL